VQLVGHLYVHTVARKNENNVLPTSLQAALVHMAKQIHQVQSFKPSDNAAKEVIFDV